MGKCLIETLPAAVAGDKDAEMEMYMTFEDQEGRSKTFACGQCALRLTVTIPKRPNECNVEDIGEIKIPA